MTIIEFESRLPKKDRAKRYLFPQKVYGRKPRKIKSRGIRVSNPPGVSVFKKIAPSKRRGKMMHNGQQSAADWVFG